jgi:protein-arginine kinase activator protein McsA
MTTPEQILCEVCHERPATHHVCNANTGKSSHLCAGCFEASALPEVGRFSAATRDAHCEYCGGQPCAGGTDFLALVTGVQKLKFMCMPCSMEHNRYVRQQLQQDASGLSQQEQLVLLRKLDEEANKHMKQWVSERGLR